VGHSTVEASNGCLLSGAAKLLLLRSSITASVLQSAFFAVWKVMVIVAAVIARGLGVEILDSAVLGKAAGAM